MCCHDHMYSCLQWHVLLHFPIFYCSGALDMIHLSCRIIPLLSVSPSRHIQAIDLLCFALTGSHWQICPCHWHMWSIGPISWMWMWYTFGSQGMIWWWIPCSASNHLQNSPQEMSFIFWHRLSMCCLPPRFMTDTLAQLYCEGHLPKHIGARSPFYLPSDLPLLWVLLYAI